MPDYVVALLKNVVSVHVKDATDPRDAIEKAKELADFKAVGETVLYIKEEK